MPIWAFLFANELFYDKINYAKAEKRDYIRDGGFRNDAQIFLLGSSHHPDSFMFEFMFLAQNSLLLDRYV